MVGRTARGALAGARCWVLVWAVGCAEGGGGPEEPTNRTDASRVDGAVASGDSGILIDGASDISVGDSASDEGVVDRGVDTGPVRDCTPVAPGTWRLLGAPLPNENAQLDVAATPEGDPVLLYFDGAERRPRARVFDGNDWTDLGAPIADKALSMARIANGGDALEALWALSSASMKRARWRSPTRGPARRLPRAIWYASSQRFARWRPT